MSSLILNKQTCYKKDKTEEITVSLASNNKDLNSVKLLGMFLDSKLTYLFYFSPVC